MFTRILVPTDFSPPSDAALEYARLLAAKFGASLHLLHVVDDPTASSAFVADSYAPAGPDLQETFLSDARQRLASLLSHAERDSCDTTTAAAIGVPAATIVDVAAASGVSLIVMGTHGRTGLAHLLMGSVAEQVVRTAPCPVLTVRQLSVPGPATATTQYRVPIAV